MLFISIITEATQYSAFFWDSTYHLTWLVFANHTELAATLANENMEKLDTENIGSPQFLVASCFSASFLKENIEISPGFQWRVVRYKIYSYSPEVNLVGMKGCLMPCLFVIAN